MAPVPAREQGPGALRPVGAGFALGGEPAAAGRGTGAGRSRAVRSRNPGGTPAGGMPAWVCKLPFSCLSPHTPVSAVEIPPQGRGGLT